MHQIFEAFIHRVKKTLRRIVGASKYEVTEDDLKQDAWIITHEIGQKRGRKIDLSDPADEELVIGRLYNQNVKRGDWKMRCSVRIDAGQVDDDGELICWSRDLAAAETADPAKYLEHKEKPTDEEILLSTSYSQAAAYVLVFFNFGNDRESIANYLAIAVGTLAGRLKFVRDIVKVQPSLFDRIEKISQDFMPKPGREYVEKSEQHLIGSQWAWEF